MATKFLFLPLLFLIVSSHSVLEPHHHHHKCAHDDLKIDLIVPEKVSLESISESRTLISWQSIRIILDFSTMTSGPADVKQYIQTQILPPVFNLLESSLKVDPYPVKLKAGGNTNVCGLTTPAIYNSDGVDADLVIFVVSVTDSNSGFIAQAGACMLSPYNQRYTLYLFLNKTFI